ncbi:MAG: DUF3365 domain-containing protein [Polaribacter sp.]|uniref:Tll0287-like domain-containing protein n=1 Tax=Polaribacter sp. TaxID=1920175 RepID=UPI003264D2FD
MSCKNSERPSYSKKNLTSKEHVGKRLMETNCYICHNPTATEDNRIGPPMIAIKRHYKKDNTTKEEFINAMQTWIKNPTNENAKMFGAVKRFGLMPKQIFPKETIEQIADYMFDNEIEQPEWFEEHYNKERGNSKGKGMGNRKGMKRHLQGNNLENLTDTERGLKYALSTKSILGKNLMGTIQKKGTLAALKFCNVKAYPLTDSMAIVNNATIKRVSDKPRNAKNLASKIEKGYINLFKENIKLNKELEPIIVESGKNVNFYYPIKTNSMCLQCHGNKTSDIKSNTLMHINELYPKDLATGYSENQVRGIWSITFNKK